MIEVKVERVGFDLENQQAVIILKEADGDRLLPIWVGALEGNSVAMMVEGLQAPRPMTHDLMKNLLDLFSVTMTMVFIDDLRDGTFFAQITMKVGEETKEIDSRPSDAVALAIRTKAPIYVSEMVLEAAGVRPKEGEEDGDGDEDEDGDQDEGGGPDDPPPNH
ncbi:MAG: bifunctional nuclease family protein [Bacillota bacterium]